MIEIAIICDNCGKKKIIYAKAARTLSFHPVHYCPKNWNIRYDGKNYIFLCEDCLKEKK